MEALRYESPQPGVSRRAFRWMMALTLINTVLIITFLVGPQIQTQAKTQWAKYQKWRADARAFKDAKGYEQLCRRHVMPANRIVYADDPAGIDAMKAAGKTVPVGGSRAIKSVLPTNWPHPASLPDPDELAKLAALFQPSQHDPSRGGLVFMHERRTPAGKARLVFVRVSVDTRPVSVADEGGNRRVAIGMTRSLQFGSLDRLTRKADGKLSLPSVTTNIIQFEAMSADRSQLVAVANQPASVAAALTPRDPLRLFAGQPDPNDPSRFSIRYEVDGEAGVIACRLLDDSIAVTISGPLEKLRRSPDVMDASRR